MGRAYSLNGFISAAMRRSGRTLLVEGVSDKDLMHRLCSERQIEVEQTYTIDEAGMISGDCCAGLGNKAKVLKVREEVVRLSSRFPRLSLMLLCLTDREWDGLADGEDRLSQSWAAPQAAESGFITHGHSIENYNFHAEHFIDYLKFAFSNSLSIGAMRLVGDIFPFTLSMASCLSLAIEEQQLIKRSAKLVSFRDFDATTDGVVLNPSFAGLLVERGVEEGVASAVVDRANELNQRYQNDLIESSSLHWLPHGHLGEEFIWSGICAYLFSAGVDEAVCDRIEAAGRAERQRFMADLLSKVPAEEAAPLHAVVDWLGTPAHER